MNEEDVESYTQFHDLPPNGEWLNMDLIRKRVQISQDDESPVLELPAFPPPPDVVDVCIFHAPCSDGTAAAFAVGKRFGDACKFFGVNRGSGDTDTELPEGLEDKTIVLVDYVYSRELMINLLDVALAVVVVDHHISELPLLEELKAGENGEKLTVIFSTQCCAATLTYKWLFPADPLPILYEYINDNDIGKWSLINTGKFVSGFAAESPVIRPGWSEWTHFEYFQECLSGGADFVRSRILVGILAKHIEWRDVYAEAQRCVERRLKVAPEYLCRVLNVSYSANGGLARALLTGEYAFDGYHRGPCDISFLYYYIDATRKWKVSLRSTDESGVNVGEVASRLGGGGHTCAASITVEGSIDGLFLSDSEMKKFNWNLRLQTAIDKLHDDRLEDVLDSLSDAGVDADISGGVENMVGSEVVSEVASGKGWTVQPQQVVDEVLEWIDYYKVNTYECTESTKSEKIDAFRNDYGYPLSPLERELLRVAGQGVRELKIRGYCIDESDDVVGIGFLDSWELVFYDQSASWRMMVSYTRSGNGVWEPKSVWPLYEDADGVYWWKSPDGLFIQVDDSEVSQHNVDGISLVRVLR